ncbi:4'-phosphopantetheinyl transferase superfamily protein [Methylobacterium organophilum]|uniref:4'-phosphopantetheinyl transferase family protein n=1 Tax=Methylobacterium organophilum TaxID=410 RepID=UPI001F138813|nr:4'-phosphopantetheinyl transferase superfamily protein [Methylobacterium organophilum]UMY18777.1 4'-phosphopantetheinyl transferase superfamily protein [Methylobacterium organophilum]
MIAPSPWIEARPGPVAGPVVWRVPIDLDAAGRAACRDLLDEAERGQADRFHRREDHDRSVGSRAALRLILGAALDCPPHVLAFPRDVNGKPDLAPPWQGRLQFNLTHSGSHALIAVSPSHRIGVDVEGIRPIPDLAEFACRILSVSEREVFRRLPESAKEDAFYGAWTRKEAVLKALGIGIGFGLERISVSLPPAVPRLLALASPGTDATAWSLHDAHADARHPGAVAIEASGASLQHRTLPAGWFRALPERRS